MSRRVFYTFVGLVAVAGLTIFGVKNDFGLGRNMEMMVNLMRVVGTEYVDTLSQQTTQHSRFISCYAARNS